MAKWRREGVPTTGAHPVDGPFACFRVVPQGHRGSQKGIGQPTGLAGDGSAARTSEDSNLGKRMGGLSRYTPSVWTHLTTDSLQGGSVERFRAPRSTADRATRGARESPFPAFRAHCPLRCRALAGLPAAAGVRRASPPRQVGCRWMIIDTAKTSWALGSWAISVTASPAKCMRRFMPASSCATPRRLGYREQLLPCSAVPRVGGKTSPGAPYCMFSLG